MTSDQDLCMVETRAQVMAKQKIASLEQKLEAFQSLVDQMQQFMKKTKYVGVAFRDTSY